MAMTIEEAIKAALDGRALLFTGSGFSIGAKNVLGNELPSAKALASKLGEKCDLGTDEGSLSDVAEYARENLGDDVHNSTELLYWIYGNHYKDSKDRNTSNHVRECVEKHTPLVIPH